VKSRRRITAAVVGTFVAGALACISACSTSSRPRATPTEEATSTLSPVQSVTITQTPTITTTLTPTYCTTGCRAIVSHGLSGDLTIIQPDTASVVTLAVGMADSFGIATVPGSAYAFAGDTYNYQVARLDLGPLLYATPYQTAGQAFCPAVQPGGSYLYSTSGLSPTLRRWNLSTLAPAGAINAGTGPYGMVFSLNGSRAYVCDYGTNNVLVVDTQAFTVIATVPAGNGTYWAAHDPVQPRVYVSALVTNALLVLDETSNTIIATVVTGIQPTHPSVDPAGTRIYVPNFGTNNVSVVDTGSLTVIATWPVGAGPIGSAVSSDGSRLLVCEGNVPAVAIVDTSSGAVIGTVSGLPGAWAVAYVR